MKILNNECISSLSDSELAVVAHAIMVLDDCLEKKKSIAKIIHDVLSNNIVLQYYDHKFFVFHHISRAYKEGVSEFIEGKEIITQQILEHDFFDEESDFFLLNILNLITLINFKITQTTIIKERLDIIDKYFNKIQDFKPYKYWTSKQRSWWTGSPYLTAALYLEMKHKIQQDVFFAGENL